MPKQEIQIATSLGQIDKGREAMLDVTDDRKFQDVLLQSSKGDGFQLRGVRSVPDLARARRLDAMGIEHPAVGSQRLAFVKRTA